MEDCSTGRKKKFIEVLGGRETGKTKRNQQKKEGLAKKGFYGWGGTLADECNA